jgi:hypothetical protein
LDFGFCISWRGVEVRTFLANPTAGASKFFLRVEFLPNKIARDMRVPLVGSAQKPCFRERYVVFENGFCARFWKLVRFRVCRENATG